MPRHEKSLFHPFVRSSSLILMAGGGGRTRTYEGLASGFTVRPLCRSGHSPISARMSRGRKRPGLAEAVPWLMLPERRACQPEICRSPKSAMARTLRLKRPVAAHRKAHFRPCNRSQALVCDASEPAARSARRPYRRPSPISTACRPYASSAAGRRRSSRRDRRRGTRPHRRTCDRRFRDRRHPRPSR